MSNSIKSNKAKLKIGNNSNNNLAIQNSNINVFCSTNDTLNALKATGSYDAIQLLFKQIALDFKKGHPLYPLFTAKPDSSFSRLVSNPETEEALEKYPKNIKATVRLNRDRYPYYNAQETPWDYAYRTQTTVELETLDYKEYLGEEIDPYPEHKFEEGITSIIEPPPFPQARKATLCCGDVSIPIELKRVPCFEYGIIRFEDVSKQNAFAFSITIEEKTNKNTFHLERIYDFNLNSQLLREKFIIAMLEHSISIYFDDIAVIRARINPEETKSDMFKIAPNLLNLIQKLLLIEEHLCVKFTKTDISDIDEKCAKMITTITASLSGRPLLEHLSTDTVRSDYNRIDDNILKDVSLNDMLVCVIDLFTFRLLGIDITIKGYTMSFKNAKINNVASIRKGIQKKRKRILISLKPQKNNTSFEKYTTIDDFYTQNESLKSKEISQVTLDKQIDN